MTVFNISPSEAVLIGCCAGEYLEARQDNEYANVLYFFWKWLAPVVPNFEQATTTSITEDELPQDVEWRDSDRGLLGLDPGDGAVLYERSPSGITRTKWNRTRSSLLDLLGDLVDPFVVKSLKDRVRFPSREDRYRVPIEENVFQGFIDRTREEHSDSLEADTFSADAASVLQTPNSPDDAEAVLNAVKHLISDNAAEDYFSIGQLFGKTSATLERWKWSCYKNLGCVYVADIEYRNGRCMWGYRREQQLTEEYRANVQHLLRARLVHECWHAAANLERESHRRISTELTSSDAIAAGFGFAEARAAIWFALGTLLGTLRGVDDAAQERDRRSLAPRPYVISSRASAEQIAGLIRMVEQTFGDPGDMGLQPEYVVNCLANAIEGLAKKLWPKEFDQSSRKGEMRNVLQAHCTTESEAEKRFSRVALTLYDLYRKPIAHGLGVFRCTWEEARFFHAGMRTLLKLSEDIEQSRVKP